MNFFKNLPVLVLGLAVAGFSFADCMEVSSDVVEEGALQNTREEQGSRKRDREMVAPAAASVERVDDGRITPVKRAIMEIVKTASDERLQAALCKAIEQYIEEENALPSSFMVQQAVVVAALSCKKLTYEVVKAPKDLCVRGYGLIQKYRGVPVTPVMLLSDEQRAELVRQALRAERMLLIEKTRKILFAASLSSKQLTELSAILTKTVV